MLWEAGKGTRGTAVGAAHRLKQLLFSPLLLYRARPVSLHPPSRRALHRPGGRPATMADDGSPTSPATGGSADRLCPPLPLGAFHHMVAYATGIGDGAWLLYCEQYGTTKVSDTDRKMLGNRRTAAFDAQIWTRDGASVTLTWDSALWSLDGMRRTIETITLSGQHPLLFGTSFGSFAVLMKGSATRSDNGKDTHRW